MPTSTVAPDSLRERLRAPAKAKGWSLTYLGEVKLKLNKSTFFARIRPQWPDEGIDFYTELAEALECEVADLLPADKAKKLSRVAHAPRNEETVMERRLPYPPDDPSSRKYSQPITEESLAVQAIGRMEHYVSALDDAEELHRRRIEELMREFRREIADVRKDLLKLIKHDDKGRKV
jgi:hypothetical protein